MSITYEINIKSKSLTSDDVRSWFSTILSIGRYKIETHKAFKQGPPFNSEDTEIPDFITSDNLGIFFDKNYVFFLLDVYTDPDLDIPSTVGYAQLSVSVLQKSIVKIDVSPEFFLCKRGFNAAHKELFNTLKSIIKDKEYTATFSEDLRPLFEGKFDDKFLRKAASEMIGHNKFRRSGVIK